MNLCDIVAGEVVIHPDMLSIPEFYDLWTNDKPDKKRSTKFIRYIVLKNKFDSPYVKTLDKKDVEPTLKLKFFGDSKYKLPPDVAKAEKAYQAFGNTLSLRLLNASRQKIEQISEYYRTSLEDELNEKKVKDILAGIGELGKTIKALDLLEANVKQEELSNGKIRGGGEMNTFEIPS